MDVQADQFFRILGDMTRLRVLILLGREGELCVCELTHGLGESQPKISRHLALLREASLVLDRRQGQWIYYRLNPGLPAWARAAVRPVGAPRPARPGPCCTTWSKGSAKGLRED